MANQLMLLDRRGYAWGKVNVRLFWRGGGQDSIWISESGSGEFNGSGIVSHVIVAGEEIGVNQRVDGNSSVRAISRNNH